MCKRQGGRTSEDTDTGPNAGIKSRNRPLAFLLRVPEIGDILQRKRDRKRRNIRKEERKDSV